ncbi:MAG: cation-translocating P-type ATPase [Bacteroidetes bacterium]|nr:cation-translocating P-type ATPase [Bacteroidota bacterium]
MTTTTYTVDGMCCADEVAAVERALRGRSDVVSFRADLIAGTVVVQHDDGIDPSGVISALAGVGLRASVRNTSAPIAAAVQRGHVVATVLSGVLTITALLCLWTQSGPPLLLPILATGAMLSGAWYVVPKAIRAVRSATLDMNVLMTTAILGAAFIGEWTEGATVAWLFALSELLEALSVGRARRAMHALLQITPLTATILDGEVLRDVPVESVAVGTTVIVRSGMRVPLDGVVVGGRSDVDQASITGESMPVTRTVGDAVYAGSIATDGRIDVEVTQTSQHSMVARIAEHVAAAQAQRSPSQRFVDSFARIYTPITFCVALAVLLVPPLLFDGAWHVWIYRSLVLLVIACPCALVIATPVAVVSGLTAMARRGVLVKSGRVLEEIGRVRAVAVDKTGTITTGMPMVVRVEPMEAWTEGDVLTMAASINVNSTHPMALAIVAAAHGRGVERRSIEHYRAHDGRGAEAVMDGRRCFVGNLRLAMDLGADAPTLAQVADAVASIESAGASAIITGHVDDDGGAHYLRVAGIIVVADVIREHAAASVQALRDVGVRAVVMLSGDNTIVTEQIGHQAGVDAAYGALLPMDKAERVRALVVEHGHVAMVGDGINDAPAMATANVGIVMGRIGSDAAIETADIALANDDLRAIAHTIRLGRRTLHTIRTNIIVALAVKAIFLVLAIAGMATLWLAIAADTGVTLVVILYALRLLRGERGE